MRYEFTIEADHNQFYLQDGYAQLPRELWSDQAMLDIIDVAPGWLGILIERFEGDIPVVVEVRQEPPDEYFADWDQVVECGIDAGSGTLTLTSNRASKPANDSHPDWPRISVRPGSYRARVFFGNLDSVDPEDYYEGEDHYRIVLWPGEVVHPRALKREMRRYEEKLREQEARSEHVRREEASSSGSTGPRGATARPPMRRRFPFRTRRR